MAIRLKVMKSDHDLWLQAGAGPSLHSEVGRLTLEPQVKARYPH